jgi:hypothetical protein
MRRGAIAGEMIFCEVEGAAIVALPSAEAAAGEGVM